MDPVTMSIQHANPYQQRAGSQQQEDCRDYLRTGRCKYGASCKYNHPSNVQTGGGLKGPIDPTEPMFPVRPNEPVCQYYMKHGTCKFGQACKFHHPPQSALTATLVGGGAVLMNVGRSGDQGHQVVLNAVATDNGGPSMMLQFLPQRPDEPDCIYFLRNGRCKYGATCRYHHPVNYTRKARDDGNGVRRTPLKAPLENSASPQIQFVMTSPTYPPSPYMQSQNASAPHVVLADGPLTFLTLDSSNTGEQSFRSLAVQQNTDLGGKNRFPVGAPYGVGTPQEQNSSSSSISSSYETAGSSMGDSASALWNARRSGSGNSLNAYVMDTSTHGPSHVTVGGGNDPSLSRRNRPASPSSSDASGVYFDTVASMSWATGPAAGGAYGAGPTWRSRRSSSFDQTRQVSQNPYGSHNDIMHRSTSVPEALGEHGQMGSSSIPARRYAPQPNRQQRAYHGTSDYNDEGLSMMTSALLNMIDTPEDSTNGFGVYEDDVTEESVPEPTTPRSGSSFRAYSNYVKHAAAPQLPSDENIRASIIPTASYSSTYRGSHEDMFSGSDFPARPKVPNLAYRDRAHHISIADEYAWSPSWQGSAAVGRQMEENAQSISAIQPSAGPKPTPGATNVGLYLP